MALLRVALCCAVLVSGHAATASEVARQIGNQLTSIASGHDDAFGARVAPAEGLDPTYSLEERARAAIDRMTSEIEAVTGVFAAASPERKIAATKAAVARFSAETSRDGASRSFEGRNPSLSIMRQVLFVPAKGGAVSANKVMEIISQFERSPKPDDQYYEYSDPGGLKTSTILDLPGSATSWTSNARPPMAPGRVYGLKKCRHIFVLGWYCNTALYEVRKLAAEDETLITFLRPLAAGEDNSVFDDDRRKNIVDGYTAVYLAVSSGDLVLVYNVGIQSRAEAPGRQSTLNEGHKQEYRQLVERLQKVLGIPALPF